MLNKFSCPVSMQVTQGQYEKDLRQGLLDLGYVVDHVTADESLNLLVTNWGNVDGVVYFVLHNSKWSNGRHFIDRYNPELFLALAAMRERDEPYPGEYFKVISDEMELYHLKKNHLYKVKHTDRSNNLTYGYLNKDYRKHLYRKATKEEVIDWFTKPQEVLPNKPYPVDPYHKGEDSTLGDVEIHKSYQGFKDSKEKLNYELDWDFIEAMAKRMSSNKSIYPPYNWKKPMDIENLKQALFRHVIEIMKGNYDDDGMERAHFMSVALNAMMIDYQLRNNNNKTNE